MKIQTFLGHNGPLNISMSKINCHEEPSTLGL
jgi:hypothetical protein